MAVGVLALWAAILTAIVIFLALRVKKLESHKHPAPDPLLPQLSYALSTSPQAIEPVSFPITPEYDVTAAWVAEMKERGLPVEDSEIDQQRRAWKQFNAG